MTAAGNQGRGELDHRVPALSDLPAKAHVDALTVTLAALRRDAPTITRWGAVLAGRLVAGGRLLAAGNGGSAAEAQHLTAELVGRFAADRRPFAAIALHADTSSLTAIGNDYGYDQVFARQVEAHARPRDVVVLLSTSGRSRNLLYAASAARRSGATTWAMTGARPNPLAELVDEALCLPGSTASVQEAQLVAIHMMCSAFETALSTVDGEGAPGRQGRGDPVTARRVS
ncbi:D-sedoheptulose-7-phosphate isomerase [Streptoalloteichus hindustanus]|uniref:D-sedoheptulose 7-phosphate isomerase n=1 Tax=Streptoalloteichus hindustanus TaxID=2017 RepID=A0A1M5AHA3_STRHI|nr:SIS domain-containing protein [Streptoalloteichus hindustanus]SHF29690.1 D-sedoheptulose 7-phosphate isomerase [Streptoalloteichus hindustanus]